MKIIQMSTQYSNQLTKRSRSNVICKRTSEIISQRIANFVMTVSIINKHNIYIYFENCTKNARSVRS